jgi:hypothetical protein
MLGVMLLVLVPMIGAHESVESVAHFGLPEPWGLVLAVLTGLFAGYRGAQYRRAGALAGAICGAGMFVCNMAAWSTGSLEIVVFFVGFVVGLAPALAFYWLAEKIIKRLNPASLDAVWPLRARRQAFPAPVPRGIGSGGDRLIELADDVYARIEAQCRGGDDLADGEDLPTALYFYRYAWDLLPEPKSQWQAATWILAALGDANFLLGKFADGRDNLTLAMQCPDAIGNPFLHLRLGQCEYELGNMDRAADELALAHAIGGTSIFENAPDKYIAFVQAKVAGTARLIPSEIDGATSD